METSPTRVVPFHRAGEALCRAAEPRCSMRIAAMHKLACLTNEKGAKCFSTLATNDWAQSLASPASTLAA
ncbi:protein of unknown function [Candidatus Filomicrobium marinum]|uniref:Uncharacterized protein n=1 Tax=Candidatus Filomicrobium marinum TaxID=1608628 RepID=A0A0D6JI28_9HYPH|nr:protein of unknown function [Candidatus Filomicrobium marinum]CPR21346.1 protein of unknown function [Candidatus Filomicrobium marinum]